LRIEDSFRTFGPHRQESLEKTTKLSRNQQKEEKMFHVVKSFEQAEEVSSETSIDNFVVKSLAGKFDYYGKENKEKGNLI